MGQNPDLEREKAAGYVDHQFAVDYQIQSAEMRVIVFAFDREAAKQWVQSDLTDDAKVTNIEFVPR